jgi:alpha-galactosidase
MPQSALANIWPIYGFQAMRIMYTRVSVKSSTNLFWNALILMTLVAFLLLRCVREPAVLAQTGNGATTRVTHSDIAPTPPMGWNSWDSYGLTINEQQFRDNVQVLGTKLKPFGWTYAVIDEGWFLRNPEDRPKPDLLVYELDAHGRYIPVPTRFPSAVAADGQNTGFAELGRWVHAQGLKFGIHIVRGIPRESVRRNLPLEGSAFHASDAADVTDACPWDPTNWGVKSNAAGQAWYDALLRQYAGWGVDLLKVDCIADHPYKVSEIRQIRLAIERSGRPIVLSLSPGPTALSHAAEVGSLAQMWRISDDIWDVWQSDAPFPRTIKSQFAAVATWASYARPGNWPDADMLALGELRPRPDVGPGPRHTRLTFEEQRTMLTLWAMARSPLILGSNLTLLDEETLGLITNKELLRIDQGAISSREVMNKDGLVAWTADLTDGDTALAIFNLTDSPLEIKKELTEFGLAGGAWRGGDVWQSRQENAMHSVDRILAPHACLLLLLRRS